MKLYCTKWALTRGIEEIDGVIDGDIVKFRRSDDHCWEFLFVQGREWHTTIESARKRCDKLRLAKIDLLKKQIVKLEKMKF